MGREEIPFFREETQPCLYHQQNDKNKYHLSPDDTHLIPK